MMNTTRPPHSCHLPQLTHHINDYAYDDADHADQLRQLRDHAAVLADMHFGFARHLRNFVVITIGTGIGGGIVVDRKLVRGQRGFAGSFGHTIIRHKGRPCTCGREGCLEGLRLRGGLSTGVSGSDHHFTELTT